MNAQVIESEPRSSSRTGSLTFKELGTSFRDRISLRKFDENIYKKAFPDEDERESRNNMRKYLKLKKDGWYEKNNYHIVLARMDGRTVAGRIFDYLDGPNVGVAEYRCVDPAFQKQGVGKHLWDHTDNLLIQDAIRAGHKTCDYVVGEMNDPLTYVSKSGLEDKTKNLGRMQSYAKNGWCVLDFTYMQPALSHDQEAVPGLKLILRVPLNAHSVPDSVSPSLVKDIVHEYMRLAMRIDDPKQNQTYEEMAAELDKMPAVRCIPMSQYVEMVKENARKNEQKEEIQPEMTAAVTGIAKSVREEYFNLSGGRRMPENGSAEDFAAQFLARPAAPEGPEKNIAQFLKEKLGDRLQRPVNKMKDAVDKVHQLSKRTANKVSRGMRL
jgi:GNAT superfamily N-acetyltransferase